MTKEFDYENMTTSQLAQQWGMNSDETALAILNTLHEKDIYIQKLQKDNQRLMHQSHSGKNAVMAGLGKFLGDSWGWIFLILFVCGPAIFGVIDKAIGPDQCPALPSQEQRQ